MTVRSTGAQATGYVGLNVGGATQNSSVLWTPNFTPPDNLGAAAAAQATLNQTGVTGGGQIGVDFGGMATNPIGPSAQFGWTPDFVFGAVVDFNYKGGDPTRTTLYASPFGGVFPIRQTFGSDFEMTLRGRVGVPFAVSPGLTVTPYATAGLALSNLWVNDGMYFPTSFNYGASSQFRAGWTAGGGFDLKGAGWPVTIQLQYLHSDFGDVAYIAPNAAFPLSFIATHHQISADRATIGANISFQQLQILLGGAAR